MLATIRDAQGLGNLALYVRLRDSVARYWNFTVRAWQVAEDASCQIFLNEYDDTDTVDSRYQAAVTVPADLQVIVEYVRSADLTVAAEEMVGTMSPQIVTVRYTKGLGNAAVYVRLRDDLARYWNWQTQMWDGAESVATKTLLTEYADSDPAESRYMSMASVPIGLWTAEYVLVADGAVLAEETLVGQTVQTVPAPVYSDDSAEQIGRLVTTALSSRKGGMFQGDLILRTAIMQGLRELKKQPRLLDFCFASLPEDELTRARYGAQTVAKAKDWFANTRLPVRLNLLPAGAAMPCITVAPHETKELMEEATTGDTHYETQIELPEDPWLAMTPEFFAGYDAATGDIEIPASITEQMLVIPGMWVADQAGQAYEILESVDDRHVRIEAGLVGFGPNVVLKWPRPASVAQMESSSFQGSFQVGCHAQGEVEHLIWLKTIVEFILLRYRQAYLEGRGFERTRIGSMEPFPDDTLPIENLFTQYVIVTGFYRNYWPKLISQTAAGVVVAGRIKGGPSRDGTLQNAAWSLDQDADVLSSLKGIK